MIVDAERHADAIAIIETLGDHAPGWLASSLRARVEAGDESGARRLREIAALYLEMVSDPRR